MAIAFVKATVASRSKGKNAVAMAAYRSGKKITDEKSGKIYDYTKKRGVEHSEILTPVAATGKNEWLVDRAELWNTVEAREKLPNSQLTRELIIAIPRELEREDQIELVREYIQASFVDRGMVADINLHHLDGDNPHAHVMLTMRKLKIDDRGVVSFGNKDRTWNDRKLCRKQKLEWDRVANKYLERAGSVQRIDSRSYQEQGIDKLPQIHLGVTVASMKSRDIPTDRGAAYDRIDWINANIAAQFEEIYNMPVEIQNLDPSPINEDPSMSQRNQQQQDADFLLVAGEHPDLKKTPEYAEAKSRYQEYLKSTGQMAAPSTPPPELDQPPAIKKWEPTLVQPANPQLVKSILAIAQDADEVEMGNYRIKITEQQIEVEYKSELAMTIDIVIEDPETHLIKPTHSIEQYERALGASIDNILEDLIRQQQDQQQQIEQQRQADLQQQLEQQQQQERAQLLEFPSESPMLDFREKPQDIDRHRQRDIGYSR